MNDITALAQRVSLGRILEISKGSTPIIGEKENLAITALYFHQELQVCTQAFQAAGLAQLAAEDALEKATLANGAQDDHINQQQDRIDTLEKRNTELGKHVGMLEKRLKGTEESLIASVDMVRELESRTVTVKLPKRSVGEVIHMSGFSRDYAEGWCSGNDNAINEMKMAGIQVIAGEGQ